MELGKLDECLQYVLQELALDDTKVPKILFEADIRSFHDLMIAKEKVKSEGIALRKPHRDALLDALEWYRFYEEQHGIIPDIVQDFSYDAFEKSKKATQQHQDRAVRDTVTKLLLEHPNPESQSQEVLDFIGLTQSDLGKHKRILNMMGELLNACNFNFENFIADCLESLDKGSRAEGLDEGRAEFLVNGPTQSGKSFIKSCVQCIGYICGVHYFIITTGGRIGFIDLTCKLQDNLSGTPIEEKILSGEEMREKMKQRKQPKLAMCAKRKRSDKGNNIIDADGGGAVVANTCTQMNMVASFIEGEREKDPDYNFILIVDECDALIRTDGGTQKAEQAYARVRDLKPVFTVMISATLSPQLLHEKWKDPARLSRMELYRIFPGDDYIGAKNLKPLVIDGEEQYLQPKELTMNSGYIYTLPGMKGFIPYTNDAVMRMYQDAARHGGLLLDATTSRVRRDIPGNVFDKAEKTTAVLFHEKGTAIGSVVVVGKGIYLKYPRTMAGGGKDVRQGDDCRANLKYLPGTEVKKLLDDGSTMKGKVLSHNDIEYKVKFEDEHVKTMKEAEISAIVCDTWVHFKPSEMTVSDAIGHLFRHFNSGIFVWGFSLMQRGQSFRSDDVVPTHLVHQYGDGYSLAKVMQSLGRATFKGKKILNRNGFSHVTVLTRRDDLDATISNYKWLDAVIPEHSDETLLDTMDGVTRKLPSEANYARHSHRKLGESKRARQRYNHNAFSACKELMPNEKRAKDRFASNESFQRMLRALHNLVSTAPEGERFDADSIIEAHNDQFRGQCHDLTKSKGRKLIREFVRERLIEKEFSSQDEKERKEFDETSYWCPDPQKLKLFFSDTNFVSANVKIESQPDTDIFTNHQAAPNVRIKVEEP